METSKYKEIIEPIVKEVCEEEVANWIKGCKSKTVGDLVNECVARALTEILAKEFMEKITKEYLTNKDVTSTLDIPFSREEFLLLKNDLNRLYELDEKEKRIFFEADDSTPHVPIELSTLFLALTRFREKLNKINLNDLNYERIE